MRIKKFIQFTVFISCLFALPLRALTSFELHNISEAHKQGFNGDGVHIGIVDTIFKEDHEILVNQFLTTPIRNTYNDKNGFSHGSHVAGIISGSRSNDESYGIAFKSKFIAYGNLGLGVSDAEFDKMLDFDVKIINNSHTAYHKRFAEYAKKGILVIYASSNAARLKPTLAALHGTGSDDNLGSWLTVGNVDSSYIQRDNSGKLTVAGRAVGGNTGNLCFEATLYCLMAAGTDILSAAYDTPTSYTKSTGTSQAAPAVSGVAALVFQKFPFLDGKQVADILLSTANDDFNAPKVVIKRDNKESHIIYIDNPVPKKPDGQNDEDAIWKDVIQMWGGTKPSFLTLADVRQATREEVFGQGILDVAKALKGLSQIDINRLSDNDAQEKDGVTEAFYTLDVKTFDATFENDISQRKWDDTLHLATSLNKPTKLNGLNAGLIKEGSGKLTLMGANTYEGATIIRNGELILEKRADDTGASLNSRVFVEKDARLNILGANTQVSTPTQSALIAKDLINDGGTVSIGERGLGLLTVNGAYTQKNNGILQLSFNSLGNSKFEANSYTIENGELQYKPLELQFQTKPQTIVIDLKQELKDSLKNFTTVSVLPSQALDYTLMPDKFTLQIIGKANAYGNYYGANPSLAQALRNIAALQNLPAQYDTYFKTLNSASADEYQRSLKSIDSNGYLQHSQKMLTMQNKDALKNILHLYDTGGGDELWFFSPNYHYATSSEYDSKGFGSKISAKKNTLNGNISAYLSYDELSSSFDYSKIKSKILSTGVASSSYLNDYLKLINGFNLGLSSNELEREIYPNKTQIKGSYKNIFAQAQLGLAQDYEAYSLLDTSLIDSAIIITPLAYLNYNLIYQNAFDEKGGFFTKNYSDLNNHKISANAGVNVKYSLLNAYNYDNADLNLYGVYERTLLGSVMRNHAYFNDFKDEKFKQKHRASKDTFRLGANLQYNLYNSFFSLGLDSQINNKEFGFNILAKAGLSF